MYLFWLIKFCWHSIFCWISWFLLGQQIFFLLFCWVIIRHFDTARFLLNHHRAIFTVPSDFADSAYFADSSYFLLNQLISLTCQILLTQHILLNQLIFANTANFCLLSYVLLYYHEPLWELFDRWLLKKVTRDMTSYKNTNPSPFIHFKTLSD